MHGAQAQTSTLGLCCRFAGEDVNAACFCSKDIDASTTRWMVDRIDPRVWGNSRPLYRRCNTARRYHYAIAT
ncbi:uncharacterized protein H6S33_008542 [Morchella sextelata]|uniref:uncharacterized protein n=1 Tax=Morchella sextelata TaxID=1174677 RepID=UPI001D038B5A|nr:uncharacterized protein H6S33_008542 [Morchella sextelata]KAH0602892.1 hypothetical protein H6S33_008542 [Morchella sextelata]